MSAGEVVQLPAAVTTAFEVQGSNEFAIASIMMGGQAQDPNDDDPQGDPSLSFEVAVEQFRSRYIFLAPTDYAESYADILVPPGATVTLDGAALSGPSTPIDSGWAVVRQPLPTTGTRRARPRVGPAPRTADHGVRARDELLHAGRAQSESHRTASGRSAAPLTGLLVGVERSKQRGAEGPEERGAGGEREHGRDAPVTLNQPCDR